MNIRNFIIAFLLFGIVSSIQTQGTFDLKPPSKSTAANCSNCQSIFNSMPPEVTHGFQVDDEFNLYFYMSDMAWFNEIFKKGTDGLAADIILKESYTCDGEYKKRTTFASKGRLLEPVYLKDFKTTAMVTQQGEIVVPMGRIPTSVRSKEYELNLVVINKKEVCYYQTYFNIERSKWQLLDMGLYTNDLILKDQLADTTRSDQMSMRLSSKTLTFIVPFEKGKTEFTEADITRIADSLELTTYDITQASIRAYSSVEGSTEFNLKLQNKRAESIIKGLQTKQTVQIDYDISTAENWIEFYEDVQTTSYRSLSKASKGEIKKALSDSKTVQELEPILADHRKAIIEFKFEKKSLLKNITDEELRNQYSEAVSSNSIDLAQELMREAFERVLASKSPTALVGNLEVPDSKDMSSLMNSKNAYRYFLDDEDLKATYERVIGLLELAPDSREIQYNSIALEFDMIIHGLLEPNMEALEKRINKLKYLDFEADLISRMLINSYIIRSEIHMMNHEYDLKEKILKKIYYKYNKMDQGPDDLLRLAQYFVAYGEYDWATKLLKPKVSELEVDEDILFYYINLTLIDPEVTSSSSYKNVLLNAINVDRERFCRLFNSAMKNGVSIQLLENDVLRVFYCESCVD